MKITKEQLKQIIKEELESVLGAQKKETSGKKSDTEEDRAKGTSEK